MVARVHLQGSEELGNSVTLGRNDQRGKDHDNSLRFSERSA